jgi:phosphoenolpyruvate synthase/pyruvate phosphate dikinase
MTEIPKFFNNLEKVATRPGTVQRDEAIYNIWLLGGKISFVSMPYKSGARAFYFEKDELKRCYYSIIKIILQDYKKHLKNYQEKVDELLAASLVVKKSSMLGNKARSSSFKLWQKALRDYYIPIIAPMAIEVILDPLCRDLLKKEFGDDAEKFFDIISSPTKINTYQKMRLLMIDIFKENKVDDINLKKLSQKYGWYAEYSYIEPAWDEKYFKAEIGKFNKKGAAEERRRIVEDTNANKKALNVFKKTIKNKRLLLLVNIINDYVFIRTERIEYFKKAQWNIRPFFESIVDYMNKLSGPKWKYSEVVNMTDSEILNFLKKDIFPKKEEIKKRISHDYVLYSYKKEGTKIVYDPRFISGSKKLINENELKDKEIKGVAAYKGIVRGKVAIVCGKNDLEKVKAGMILVARTTMPDYTQAMKRASAIITEEGGVTSHAAIIARELKTPCIVSTKIATQVLQDGDLVEVNADKGIVKKLK